MPLASDWGFTLAQQFLDAAVSCGAECANRFVIPPGFEPSGGCDDAGCACRLTVSVLEGLTKASQCAKSRTARIEITLEVCAPTPGKDGNIDPVKAAGVARDQSTLRWLILSGLYKAWTEGQLCAGGPCIAGRCQNFTPSGWEPLDKRGTCLRYRMVWNYAEAIA